MKLRSALYVIIGTLVAVALVFFSTRLQPGAGSSLAEMVNAQRHTPLLWLVDVYVLGLAAAMWWFAVMSNHFQRYNNYQATQHRDQLNEMIERTLDLEQTNDSYADQIERLDAEVARRFRNLTDQITALETIADTRREVFEMEARRIAEHSQRRLQTQIDTNTDQVEAIGVSLQFHRSELRRLRQHIRDVQAAAPRADALCPTPPEFAAALECPLAATSLPAMAQSAQSFPDLAAAKNARAVAPPPPAAVPNNGCRGQDCRSTMARAECAPATEQSPENGPDNAAYPIAAAEGTA